jgi:hypothetical protein
MGAKRLPAEVQKSHHFPSADKIKLAGLELVIYELSGMVLAGLETPNRSHNCATDLSWDAPNLNLGWQMDEWTAYAQGDHTKSPAESNPSLQKARQTRGRRRAWYFFLNFLNETKINSHLIGCTEYVNGNFSIEWEVTC